ncbi:MAG: hypothetical protein ACFFDT_24930 [Candidatus Hodarchaeota archaeon]
MPIIRITNEDVKKAAKARKEALKKDPEFRDFEEEMEKQMKEALKEEIKEGKL